MTLFDVSSWGNTNGSRETRDLIFVTLPIFVKITLVLGDITPSFAVQTVRKRKSLGPLTDVIIKLDQDESDAVVGRTQMDDKAEKDDCFPEELVLFGLVPQIPENVAGQNGVAVVGGERGGRVAMYPPRPVAYHAR